MRFTLLPSAARDASADTDAQTLPPGRRGLMLVLDVTGAPAESEETLTVSIEAQDVASDAWAPVTAFAATAKATELEEGATLAYTLYPGASETAALEDHEVMALPCPPHWRAVVTHSGAGAWTYSLGCLLLN